MDLEWKTGPAVQNPGPGLPGTSSRGKKYLLYISSSKISLYLKKKKQGWLQTKEARHFSEQNNACPFRLNKTNNFRLSYNKC